VRSASNMAVSIRGGRMASLARKVEGYREPCYLPSIRKPLCGIRRLGCRTQAFRRD
jgi:hypothetical protein